MFDACVRVLAVEDAELEPYQSQQPSLWCVNTGRGTGAQGAWCAAILAFAPSRQSLLRLKQERLLAQSLSACLLHAAHLGEGRVLEPLTEDVILMFSTGSRAVARAEEGVREQCAQGLPCGLLGVERLLAREEARYEARMGERWEQGGGQVHEWRRAQGEAALV